MTVASRALRGALAGLAGGITWLIGIALVFGPAQAVLTNPDYQSAKMIAAFAEAPSPPRAFESPGLVVAGLLGIGVLWGCVFAWLASSWQGSWTGRGLRFGAVSWALMVPWFEFYLPWNVLREPAALVLLEMACWALVLIPVGLAISGVEALLRPRS
ncbi:MAG: hypothetical protein ACREAA_20340 [Candidatus Polarisedimenticolia bacterium]